MADKVRDGNDKMAEKTLNNPVLIQAPDIMRMEEQEKQSMHLNQTQGVVPAPRKKTSSFQITSVTVAAGSRLSNDGGDDSADDLDESHTEDISSELLDISKTTDIENDYSSEDVFSSVDPVPAPNVHPMQHQIPNNGQGDASHLQVPVSTVNNSDDTHHDRSIPWHTRFRVVKIESSEPFKRGRWICMDFTDPPPSQNDSGEKESGSGNSSAASSMQYGESFLEIPVGQEVFYQQSDSQQQNVPLQSHHQSSVEQNVQTNLINQPQSVLVHGVTDFQQNQSQMGNNIGSTPVVVPQHQTQSLVQPNVQSGMMPPQHMAVHHGSSLPVPLQAQTNPVQPSDYYNVPQGGNTMAPPLSQTDFQGVQMPSAVPPTEYVGVPQHGSSMPAAGLHQAEYVSVHPPSGTMPTGMMPGDYVTPAQSQLPPSEYNVPPSMPLQTEYVNIHQTPADYMNIHQQGGSIPPVMPPTEYMQSGGMPPHPSTSLPPPPTLQSVHQQGTPMPPPQGDYSIHQQGAPQMSTEYHTHASGAQGLVQPSGGMAPGLPQGTAQGITPQVQSSNSTTVPPTMVAPNMPPNQPLLPASIPQQVGDYEYVSIPVGQNNATSGTLPPSAASVASSNQQAPAPEQVYNIPNSRPSTITISSTSTESAHDTVGSTTVTITPPMLDNLSVSGKEGEDPESASGSSTVAIDNKIEQAMDLVKSHLMFAVREEVEVLKEKIMELTEKISQLEKENTILRAAASQETLAKLPQPSPKSQPSKPTS